MGPHIAGTDVNPRRRVIAAAGLLALSLALGAVLAVQSIQAARIHRATAERVLQDYASFAALNLASHIERQLSDAATRTFAFWTPPGHPPMAPGLACPGGNTYFEEREGRLQFSGASLPATEATFLHDSLVRGGTALHLLEEGHWRFRFVRAPSAAVDGYFILRRGGLAGYSVCFRDGVPPADAPSLFRHVMLTERALPEALVGNTPADSFMSVSVTAGQGRTLYTSPNHRPSRYSGVSLVGPDHFGNLSVQVDLNPDLAGRLIVGGVPASRAPLAIALVGLSVILVIAALLQLRREYNLIATRSGFVANVSHELRTPLSQILLFTELLKLDRLRSDAERARALDVIDQETRRLIRLVENVLQFSRAGSPRSTPHPEALPLDAAVRETIDAFQPLAVTRGVTVQSQIPPQASVRADRGGFRQILLNLLDNAVKYGPKDQVIRVEAQSIKGRTRISVDDQGPGIPRGERERIWEGHYRLRRDAGSTVTGSGLGLAVVRSLAKEMHGSAWVEDSETGGARFVVELPSGDGDYR